MNHRICFLTHNYRGLDSSGNKAKHDNEVTLREIGAVNLGVPTTYYDSKVASFFLDLAGVVKLSMTVSRGDIVVLRKESFMTAPIIKRVIATEGQTIDIDFQEGVVYIDGAPLDEPYVNALTLDPEDFTEAVTVPEGCVFVMGDNRNRSTDSRSARLGCVDERYIIGKVLFRFSPLNKFGRVA